ncbi:sperm acrosome membrane-associated protein 4-like [Paroedura picta]|uniref:sperm acrosome membrane-associated protein 4-like n=1 Tax=Paroedura picta TaxID=143630 RepID=UPI004055F407
MGKILILCAAILACTSIGSALHCYKCKFTFFNIPCATSNITCQAGEVCATIDGAAVGHTFIKKKDCVPKDKCGTNSTVEYVNVKYTTTYNCCEGNACNSATMLSSAHFSLSMAPVMLGFWFTKLL